MDNTCYSFQTRKLKIVAVSLIFGDGPKISMSVDFEQQSPELSQGPVPEFNKKRRFCQFFVSTPKKISAGCQSVNFDPRRSAYGSSESFCPIFFKTPAKKVIIFKNVGASPLQSQVIQNLATQKRCFLGTFFEKIAILNHFDQTTTPP